MDSTDGSHAVAGPSMAPPPFVRRQRPPRWQAATSSLFPSTNGYAAAFSESSGSARRKPSDALEQGSPQTQAFEEAPTASTLGYELGALRDENNAPEILVDPSQDASPSEKSSRFSESSFVDHQFASSNLRDGHAVANPPRPRSPAVFVEGRPLGDEDYEHERGNISASDTDQSEGFKSIITVDDLGFGVYETPQKKVSLLDQVGSWTASPRSRHHASGHSNGLASTSGHAAALHEVGSSFPPQQLGPSASSEELVLDESEIDVESLGYQIRRSWVKSEVSGLHFVPLSTIFSIVSESNVRILLRQAYPEATEEQLDGYWREICGPDISDTGRRKIFAILIIISKVQCIRDFIDAGLQDVHLPLKLVWHYGLRKYKLYHNHDVALSAPLDCCSTWSKLELETFEHNQPYMLAPYFHLPDNQVYFYKNIDPSIVLPFIEYERATSGGYGTVWKVKIHRAHHSFQSKNSREHNPYFAVKELHSDNYDTFRKEVEVLEKFSGANRSHPHLIRLLLTYQRKQKYYLVFPWADGNLKEFWRKHPSPLPCQKNARWLMKQCHGIASGLRKIHRITTGSFPNGHGGGGGRGTGDGTLHANNESNDGKDYGRHGDIKPENILWFSHHHRLVISDFGLTRYHTFLSKSNDKRDGGSTTYRPPESDLQKPITQRYDIWTLGCLYLEFISWFVRGNEETERDFTDARLDDDNITLLYPEDKFFNIVLDDSPQGRHAEVKTAVKEWISKIRVDCPEFISDFLSLVEDHLLVPESGDRWTCAAVCTELDRICKRCDEEPDYCLKPNRHVTENGMPHDSLADVVGDNNMEASPIEGQTPERSLHSSDGIANLVNASPNHPTTKTSPTEEANDDPPTASITPKVSGQGLALQATSTGTSRLTPAELRGKLDQLTTIIAGVNHNDAEASPIGEENDDDSSDNSNSGERSACPRRRADMGGRPAPPMPIEETVQTSQGSGDPGAIWSANTSPPFTRQNSDVMHDPRVLQDQGLKNHPHDKQQLAGVTEGLEEAQKEPPRPSGEVPAGSGPVREMSQGNTHGNGLQTITLAAGHWRTSTSHESVARPSTVSCSAEEGDRVESAPTRNTQTAYPKDTPVVIQVGSTATTARGSGPHGWWDGFKASFRSCSCF